MSKTLKENIQSNAAAIWYYTGVFIVAAFNVTVKNMNTIIPQNTWWGQMINGIADLGLIYFTIIAKFIFGQDANIDRVKNERQLLGEENTTLQIENEALKVTNTMMGQVMAEAGVTKINFNKPWVTAVPKVDKLDEDTILPD